MITPKFDLSQTDTTIIINVHAPYTNVKKTEIDVNGDSVIFFSTPYYLRLSLPGNVEEADDSNANYNADDGKYTITLHKINKGEHFPNLDMLATLLQPKGQKTRIKPLIEVISDDCVKENSETLPELTEDDWFIEQSLDVEMDSESPDSAQASTSSALLNKFPYGFLNTHSGLQDKYSVELGEVSEIRNPDVLSEPERRKLREAAEQEKFSDDHYLADFMENEEVGSALKFKLDMRSLKQLTEKNKETLKDLGNREFLFDNKVWVKRTYLGLIDILYAYCYDWRVTEGQHCCESPWNISRLSATLSWFDIFDSVHDVIHSCMRRSLSYPLLRHWKLSRSVMKDVLKILKGGPVAILICLLDIKDIFSKREPYYLLNQLYIEEYCVWIQKVAVQSKNLASIAVALEKTFENYDKSKVGFDLEVLEAAANACEDEAMEEEISDYVRSVSIA